MIKLKFDKKFAHDWHDGRERTVGHVEYEKEHEDGVLQVYRIEKIQAKPGFFFVREPQFKMIEARGKDEISRFDKLPTRNGRPYFAKVYYHVTEFFYYPGDPFHNNGVSLDFFKTRKIEKFLTEENFKLRKEQ